MNESLPIDPWANRSEGMRCRTCLWFVSKDPGYGADVGRCRRHAPTMGGYPVVLQSDWCGDHRLNERVRAEDRKMAELRDQAAMTTRDPHLPPPEVCDWLLSQEWSGSIPETAISYPKGNPTGICGSAMLDYEAACAAIGADEIGRVFLPVEALDVLRADQEARRAVKEERAKIQADEERRRAERELNRPCELGLLPMIVSETGADGEPEIERIICRAISGGADYLNDMPREVSLERITTEGAFHARYTQMSLEAAS